MKEKENTRKEDGMRESCYANMLTVSLLGCYATKCYSQSFGCCCKTSPQSIALWISSEPEKGSSPRWRGVGGWDLLKGSRFLIDCLSNLVQQNERRGVRGGRAAVTLQLPDVPGTSLKQMDGCGLRIGQIPRSAQGSLACHCPLKVPSLQAKSELVVPDQQSDTRRCRLRCPFWSSPETGSRLSVEACYMCMVGKTGQ